MLILLLSIAVLAPIIAHSDEELIDHAEQDRIAKNSATEPLIETFSIQSALQFSQRASDQWAEDRKCITCHTNGLQLVTAAHLAPKSEGNLRSRQFAKDYLRRYVVEKEPPSRQHGSVEGKVATACFLAISDILTTGQLSDTARSGFEHLWTLQDDAGSWSDWLKCGWPPYESDDHFGVTLVALAVSFLDETDRSTKSVQRGIQQMLRWLETNPPENLHHKGMLIWANARWVNLIQAKEMAAWQREILSAQQSDGGWRLVDLGASKWKRPTDEIKELTSDAYATAFSLFSLRNSGLEPSHPAIKTGLAWLKRQQRQSGRWFTRSPRRDDHHFISHAATHFAILAIDSCQLPEGKIGEK